MTKEDPSKEMQEKLTMLQQENLSLREQVLLQNDSVFRQQTLIALIRMAQALEKMSGQEETPSPKEEKK